ncbi:MAG: prephenate dehydratase [Chloroflexi bacterium]|nr:prephenate dehydratase [Chloroflexota bacterium]
MSKRVAYLGPAGTFTEQATLKYAADAQLLPFASITAVAAAVGAEVAEEGVVPIENSLQGSVTETLDLLIHGPPIFIRHELALPIEHYLMGKPGVEVEKVQVIYSHPQALAQCRSFLERCFPKAQMVAALSTTGAVEQMQQSPTPAAAIAPLRAAELYGAEVLARHIQDNPNNVTRFVVLGHSDHNPTGGDKTSICFSFAEDRPGLLYAVMGEFARRNINLTKVESRPTRQVLGEYIFLVDLEGHREDTTVRDALEQVRGMTSMFKVLGSYPRMRTNPHPKG